MAYQTINPYTEELLQSFESHSDGQLDTAIATAERTYTDDWSRRTVHERKSVVNKAAALLRAQRDIFAEHITLEMGKLFPESLAEVDLTADILDYYADNAEAFLAPVKLEVVHGEAVMETHPLGIIFCVEPWNLPYYQLARVVSPNLMTGNTVIAKHSPNVPQCALAFEKLFRDAGAPVGAYTNLFISNDQATTVIMDKRIRGVALTGSVKAGTAVAAEAGKALKRSTMELGGSDAFIVLDDADMDTAIKFGVTGRINNSGQNCAGSKRFILDETIADVFLERFSAELRKLIPGDPMDPKTTLAPLCTEAALENAEKQIKTAVDGGATVLLGGNRVDRQGYFLEPTILIGVTRDNAAFYDEFFCPVALIFRVKNEDEAIALANDSLYGLGGSIITKDTERGKRIARRIESGMSFINSAVQSAPNLPFGGVKDSGYGRELSSLGMSEFVNNKLIMVS